MRRVRYFKTARADLDQIFRYIAIASGSIETGRGFQRILTMQCRKLAELPGTLGRARPEIGPEIRSFAVRNYIILFRYRDETVEILNVIEGHRDFLANVDLN